jgi:hypothetical protein
MIDGPGTESAAFLTHLTTKILTSMAHALPVLTYYMYFPYKVYDLHARLVRDLALTPIGYYYLKTQPVAS